MSTGFVCDKCEQFVAASAAEQRAARIQFTVPLDQKARGRHLTETEEVHLCGTCRHKLAEWIGRTEETEAHRGSND